MIRARHLPHASAVVLAETSKVCPCQLGLGLECDTRFIFALTFKCRFSSAILPISDCNRLHFSSNFFISLSSNDEAEALAKTAGVGAAAAAIAGAEGRSALAEFITGADLLESASF